MSFGENHNGIWDEYQWEKHINGLEHKSRQLRKFITPQSDKRLPRWLQLLREHASEEDALEAYIDEEMAFEDTFLPPDDEDEENPHDEYGMDEEDFNDGPMDDEWNEAGEDWKQLSGEFAMTDYGMIENLHIYRDARRLALQVLRRVELIPSKAYTAELLKFVKLTLRICSKIVSGYSFGFDLELIGGNIVYNKKALNSANRALLSLPELKTTHLISKKQYYEIHEQLFELRNQLGIYIQELRERFEQGYE